MAGSGSPLLGAVHMLRKVTPRRRAAAHGRPTIATFRRLLRHAGRRLGWGVADQAVSSLTNFAVVIYVARAVGAAQFGAFSLAYVTYGFALNASRGLATDPLLVRFSGVDVPTWRRAVAGCTGTAAAVGLVTGGCVLVAAALLDGTVKLAFLALGLTLPGLLLQDSWRYAFFALGRGSQAALNDLVWASVLVPATGAPACDWPRKRVLVRFRVGRRGGCRRRRRTAAGTSCPQAVRLEGSGRRGIVTSGPATSRRTPPTAPRSSCALMVLASLRASPLWATCRLPIR